LHLSDLDRVVRIQGPSPAATAVGDGLALAFSALSEAGLRATLHRWGLLQAGEDVEVQTNPLPVQAAWEDRQMAPFLVADASERRIQVKVELIPDPPLFAELRALGAKAPRLATALGADPVLQLDVSAFFAASWDVLSLAVQSFSVASERFPTTGKERPEWLTGLLLTMGNRFWHHQPVGEAAAVAMSAMTSANEQAHKDFLGWQQSLKEDLGTVRPVRGPAGSPVLLADEQPMRRFGRFGNDRTELSASVFFSGADILWAGLTDAWVEGFVHGDHSALEQVWRIDPNGSIDPHATSETAARSVLSFSPPAGEE